MPHAILPLGARCPGPRLIHGILLGVGRGEAFAPKCSKPRARSMRMLRPYNSEVRRPAREGSARRPGPARARGCGIEKATKTAETTPALSPGTDAVGVLIRRVGERRPAAAASPLPG